MRVLVFGDSITQGCWDVEGGWVERLRKHYDYKQLENLHDNDEPTIFNLGISADNSEDILQRICPEIIARTRHGVLPIVILQIGVNDSASGQESDHVDIEKYKTNLEEIVSKTKKLCTRMIFIGSSACDETKTLPVFWKNVDYCNKEISAYEKAMQQVAQAQGIQFIPLFDQFKKALNSDQDLLSDGLHPNGEGHKFIANIIRQGLDKII